MKVKIDDNSKYKSETCNTGGDYGFSTYYTERPDGRFDVTHSTTADFAFCPLCGRFYQRACPCGMEEPEVVDLETVNREISYAMREYAQGEDWEISIS